MFRERVSQDGGLRQYARRSAVELGYDALAESMGSIVLSPRRVFDQRAENAASDALDRLSRLKVCAIFSPDSVT